MLTIKDLLLGLANTSTSYGRLRSNTLTANTLNELWDLGLTAVDSSESYSNADNVLGQSGRQWKIQNKITLTESNLDFVKMAFKLRTMNAQGNIKSLLIHTPDLYLYKNINKTLLELRELVLDANIPKFGISIYRPIELENLESLDAIDVIQFPHNPFDTSCADWCTNNISEYQKILQARSIFLQGLLVSEDKEQVNFPPVLKENLGEWQNWLRINNLKSWEFCVDFVFQDPRISQVVFGIESSQQARNIVSRLDRTLKVIKYPFIVDSEATNPRSWNN